MTRLIVSALLLFCTTDGLAEAWPRGRGHLYGHLGASTFESSRLFDPSGNEIPFPGRDARERRLSLYLEYGLTERLTLVAAVPYRDVVTRGLVSDFQTEGLADLDLRLRFSRPVAATWMALELGGIVPLGYDTDAFPNLGSREADAIASVALGSSLPQLPEGFLSLDLGYRARGGVLADEMPFALKIGAFPWRRIGTFAFLRGWESQAQFERLDPNFALISADSERLAGGLEVYVRLTTGLDFNFTATRILQGRNTSTGSEFSAGLAFHR